MPKLKEYKIQIDFTFSRILDIDEINVENIDSAAMELIDRLNNAFIGLKFVFVGMEIDLELENLIFVNISSNMYTSTEYPELIFSIAKSLFNRLLGSMDSKDFLEDYYLEKSPYLIFEIESLKRLSPLN
jgi:hypothetical protein